jgi:hypothetical protein
MVGLHGLDAWLTREPDYEGQEPVQPRCEACGGFLSVRAEQSEPWEQTEPCDGQGMVVHDFYTQTDRHILDIIGWEHLGEARTTEYDPVCGRTPAHLPHDYVVAGGTYEYRTCSRCGTVNKDTII